MQTIQESAKQRVLLAAHRGVAGGNIPCNSIASYEIALNQGADIVEIDVSVSADRKLFVFHPGMERPHLNIPTRLADMPAVEIEKLVFTNQDNVPCTDKIATLDEVLDLLKGKAYVNIDKFWTAVPEITECVRRHGMQNDVIVKTSADKKWFDMVEQIAPELPYMPIIRSTDRVSEELLGRKINFIGAEVLFYNDADAVASPEYIQWMHDHGLLLWANAIVYNCKEQIAAGHSDDVAMVSDPDGSWGWLVDRGFDIIQTDWQLPCRMYLEATNRRYR
ncbi:MAG: glycerophosphodiester phosphodiesterase family protein [Clostridia bacterium]|nr:glycerophosphodiester phosphodiesterase family protein [Clostridia bacterium]